MKKYKVSVFIRGCMPQNIYGQKLEALRKRGIKLLTLREPGMASTFPVRVAVYEHVREIDGNSAEWKEIESVDYASLKDDQLEWKRPKTSSK